MTMVGHQRLRLNNRQSPFAIRHSQFASLFLTITLLAALTGCAPYDPNPTPTPTAAPAVLRVTASTTLLPAASALVEAFQWPHAELVKRVESLPADRVVQTLEQGTSNVVFVAGQLPNPLLPGLEVTAVGQVPLAIIVHRSNSIQNLTSAQVREVFAGEVLDWASVGSASGPIRVVTQPPNSEAWMALTTLLLPSPSDPAGRDSSITRAALLAVDDQGVGELVASEAGAIGYAAVGSLPPGVRVVALDGVRPTPAELAAGRYPLVQPIHLITLNDPPAHVRELVDFALSPTGQELLAGALGPRQGEQ